MPSPSLTIFKCASYFLLGNDSVTLSLPILATSPSAVTVVYSSTFSDPVPCREVDPDHLGQARADAGGEQGMAAEGEEIVVDAKVVAFQHLAPKR